MYTTATLLDAYKAKMGIASDYALAKHFDVNKQHISQYRCGARGLGDDRAVRIAQALGIDPGVVLVSLQAERAQKAQNEPIFSALSGLLRRLDTVAA